MTHNDRKDRYEQYIAAIKRGDLTEALTLRKESFDVTDTDINEACDAAVNSSNMLYRERSLAVMTEDMRDMRDCQQINATRSVLVQAFTDTSDMESNKHHMFISW